MPAFPTPPFIWLASQSPRRKELLAEHGYAFATVQAVFRETIRRQVAPEQNVMRNACGKARRAVVPAGRKGGIILGADTVVFCRNRILGKPRTLQQAKEMLGWIQGRDHWVYTGICLRHPATGREQVAFERTRVRIRTLALPEIEAIVRLTRPLDKAGAYAIQDQRARLIEHTAGSFSNVIGLPMELLAQELQKLQVLLRRRA